MKKKLMLTSIVLTLTFAMLSFAGTVKAQSTATVFIDAPDYINELGTFQVDVNISDVSGLYGWEFKLYYNRTLLNYTGYDLTDHFLEQAGITFPIDNSNPDYNMTHGLIWLADSLMGAPSGVDGNGTLVTLTFNATEEGIVDLIFEDLSETMPGINIKLGDINAEPIENVATGKTMTIDYTSPEITSVTQFPTADNVQPTDNVAVNATVTDAYSPIKNVTLYYTTDNGTTWEKVPMTNLVGDIYNATIPKQDAGTQVKYKIEAFDEAENKAVEDQAGNYYVYTVLPEFPTSIALMLIITVTTLTLILAKREKLKIKKNH